MTRNLAMMICITALCATIGGDRVARGDTVDGAPCTPSTDGFDQPSVDCGGGNGDGYPPPGFTLPHYYGTPALYRVYAAVSGDHFYSIDYNETNNAIWYSGYGAYEGIIGRCTSSQSSGQVPLYRFDNTYGYHHFYTSNQDEANSLMSAPGYVYEGVACYIYPSWQSNAQCEIYRIRINGNHFYTTDANERAAVLWSMSIGAVDEGSVGFMQCP